MGDPARTWTWALVAMVLGAALAVVALGSPREPAAILEGDAPTAPAAGPAAVTVVLLKERAPAAQSTTGELETHHILPVHAGERALRVNVTFGAVRNASATHVVLIEPDGSEAMRCTAPTPCFWTAPEPAVGQWILALPPESRVERTLAATIERVAPPPAETALYNQWRALALAPRTTWRDTFLLSEGQTGFDLAVATKGNAACGLGTQVVLYAPDGDTLGATDTNFAVRNVPPGRYALGYTVGPCEVVRADVVSVAK